MNSRMAVALVVGLGALFLGSKGTAQTIINSLNENGRITWTATPTPATCHVEWASSPEGPWYQTWSHLKGIVATGATAMAQVPLHFRVVSGPRVAPTNGLVAYYPLEGNGLDASGNGHNGSLVSGPITTNGRIGQALYLDANMGRVTVPGSYAFAFTNLTIAAWVRCANYSNAIPSHIATDATSTGTEGGFVFDVSRARLHFHYRISTAPIFYEIYSANVFLPSDNDKWVHTAVTCSYSAGAYTVLLYRDGELIHSENTVSPPMAYANNTLILGNAYDLHLFGGVLDEVYFYNRALTGTEVRSLFDLAP